MARRTAWEWVQLLGGLGLGLGMLAWFVSSLEWVALGEALSTVHTGWLLAALVVLLGQYAFHAWRWGVLLKHVDPEIGPRLLWSSTAVLWGFNTVMPLRAGNLLRPLVIARARNLAYPTVLFATIAEYVFDAAGILVMIGWLVWLLPPDQATGPVADALNVARSVGIGAVGMFLGILLLSTRQAHSAVTAALRPIPSDWLRDRATVLFEQLVEGMASVSSPLRFVQAFVLTLGVWGCWLGGLVCTLHAFRLDLPLAAALFLEAALTLAMMVPQAPGFLGVFQVVTEEVLNLWNTPAGAAQGVALVFWSLCFVPITIVGLVEGARHGVGTQVDT